MKQDTHEKLKSVYYLSSFTPADTFNFVTKITLVFVACISVLAVCNTAHYPPKTESIILC